MNRLIILLSLFAGLIFFNGCAEKLPEGAFCHTGASLQERQLQTRRFESKEEIKILNASAAVLQDLGFTVDEVERPLGVISCSKRRDATSAGQIAAAIFIAALGGGAVPVDDYQIIRASIITQPIQNNTQVAVRVTFQRVIYNTARVISLAESIVDPKIYQDFYEKLSKSIFLEAHEI